MTQTLPDSGPEPLQPLRDNSCRMSLGGSQTFSELLVLESDSLYPETEPSDTRFVEGRSGVCVQGALSCPTRSAFRCTKQGSWKPGPGFVCPGCLELFFDGHSESLDFTQSSQTVPEVPWRLPMNSLTVDLRSKTFKSNPEVPRPPRG